MVRFSCCAGSAVGRWIGSALPSAGHSYDVELDFEGILDRGENTVASSETRFLISEREDEVVLNGSVDSVDADGLVYFRLGVDCLVMVDARAGEFSEGEWLEVSCRPEHLHLTPFGA